MLSHPSIHTLHRTNLQGRCTRVHHRLRDQCHRGRHSLHHSKHQCPFDHPHKASKHKSTCPKHVDQHHPSLLRSHRADLQSCKVHQEASQLLVHQLHKSLSVLHSNEAQLALQQATSDQHHHVVAHLHNEHQHHDKLQS